MLTVLFVCFVGRMTAGDVIGGGVGEAVVAGGEGGC